jgi:arginine/serine-rich splicing factor 12
MDDLNNTKVIQITNIAPQATRDQMHLLFQNIGKIDDLRLYPSIRDASVQIPQRCCFLKFVDGACIPLALHMTNTVFIDRAIIVTPFVNGDLPDEWSGLEFANASQVKGERCLPSHVTNEKEGDVLNTKDTTLADAGLPNFPGLPASTEEKTVEEIRRSVTVINIDPTMSAQACLEFFGKNAGEVKYFRWCTKEGDERKMALVEFTDYGAVIPAMRLNDTVMGNNTIKVYYATQAITKPQTKSNETAQKEIEEAMKKVKEAQNLVSDAVNPLKEWLGVKGGTSRMTRSRSPSPFYRRSSRRSRSRSRHRRRSRSSRRRRSRSRSRRRRSRSRRSSRSRRKSRSRSRDRKKDKRSRSKDKIKEEKVEKEKNGDSEVKKEKEEKDKEVNGVKQEPAENGKVKKEASRSRSKSRKRSRTPPRKRSRSRSKKRTRRSPSRSRKRRSRSRRKSRSKDRRRRSKSKSRSRSRDHRSSKKSKKSKRSSEDRDVKKEKITRDYDAEEAGYEAASIKEEKGPVPMEISNSP